MQQNSAFERNNQCRPHKRNVYEELNPVFKELVQALELNCSFDDIKRIKDSMNHEIVSAKARYTQNDTCAHTGTLVSSHVASNMQRKSKRTKF